MTEQELRDRVEQRIGFMRDELRTFGGHVYRKDKAKADSSLVAMHIYIDSLQRLVSTLPDPPNERPGYAYSNRPEP